MANQSLIPGAGSLNLPDITLQALAPGMGTVSERITAVLTKKYAIATNAADGTSRRLWVFTDTSTTVPLVSGELVTAAGGFFKYVDSGAVVGVDRPAALLGWGATSSSQAFSGSCWATGIQE